MAEDVTTPPDTELIRQGASRIRELKTDLEAGYYLPSGTIMMFGGSIAPAAWLLCDGSAVSRDTYANLFTALADGTIWGTGDGSTTFNLPDMRGRAPIGSGAGSGLTSRSLAQGLGEEKHTLTTDELASHSHGITDPGHGHSLTDPGHGHGVTDPGHAHVEKARNQTGSTDTIVHNAVGNSLINMPDSTASASTGVTVASATTGASVGNNNTGIPSVNATGGGSSHNVMQPSMVVNFMIKV